MQKVLQRQILVVRQLSKIGKGQRTTENVVLSLPFLVGTSLAVTYDARQWVSERETAPL